MKLLRVTCRFIVGLVLLLAVLLVWPLPEMPRQGVAGDFLVRNVTIVDIEASVLRTGQNVVVLDGRIASVGSTETAYVQDSTRRSERRSLTRSYSPYESGTSRSSTSSSSAWMHSCGAAI